MLTKGTLVRIRGEALDQDHEDGGDSYMNLRAVGEHGHLWRVEDPSDTNTPEEGPREELWDLRSIATGVAALWFRYEFETMEEADAHPAG